MSDRYRLRATLVIGREKDGRDKSGRWLIRDRQLKRALRLGDVDRRLAQLLARPRGATLADLQSKLRRSEQEVAARLTGLARLYLLSGERGRGRVALQPEQDRWRRDLGRPPTETNLQWPEGANPPQHACVATGACCSASFLGPMTHVDKARVSGLKMGGRSRVRDGAQALETLTFRGVQHTGMARHEGRCVAQGPDELCDVHAEHGMAAKPVPCRQFPLRFHRSPRGVHVSLLLACAGYDRAREAAGPWLEREAEVRGLLAEGAAAPAVAVPFELAAGVPIAAVRWWQLSQRWTAMGASAGDVRGWLAAVIDDFEATLGTLEFKLREGAAIGWAPATTGLARALRGPAELPFNRGIVADHRRELMERSHSLVQESPADARRLARLAEAFDALLAGQATAPQGPRPASVGARQQLWDVVANDLPLQVALGHVDAGLASLARRVLLADALACHLAALDEVPEVTAKHTTAALVCVIRSEPDVVAVGRPPQAI